MFSLHNKIKFVKIKEMCLKENIFFTHSILKKKLRMRKKTNWELRASRFRRSFAACGSFIRNKKNISRRYECGTRPASRLKGKPCVFPREILLALSARITQGMNARARLVGMPLYEARSIPRSLYIAVPNCSARFHLTHVALECRAPARIGKQREVPTTYI